MLCNKKSFEALFHSEVQNDWNDTKTLKDFAFAIIWGNICVKIQCTIFQLILKQWFRKMEYIFLKLF